MSEISRRAVRKRAWSLAPLARYPYDVRRNFARTPHPFRAPHLALSLSPHASFSRSLCSRSRFGVTFFLERTAATLLCVCVYVCKYATERRRRQRERERMLVLSGKMQAASTVSREADAFGNDAAIFNSSERR